MLGVRGDVDSEEVGPGGRGRGEEVFGEGVGHYYADGSTVAVEVRARGRSCFKANLPVTVTCKTREPEPQYSVAPHSHEAVTVGTAMTASWLCVASLKLPVSRGRHESKRPFRLRPGAAAATDTVVR